MVINTGDLRYLLKLTDYSQLPEFDLDLLNEAWINIYNEFSDIAGGNRSDLYLVKMKRITSMKMDHDLKMIILNAADAYPSEEMAELVADLGFKIEGDLQQSIASARQKLKSQKQKIQVIEHQNERDDYDPASMDSLIATLERYQGYQFNEHEMSISKFAHIYKQFKDARKQDNI